MKYKLICFVIQHAVAAQLERKLALVLGNFERNRCIAIGSRVERNCFVMFCLLMSNKWPLSLQLHCLEAVETTSVEPVKDK